MILEDIQHSHPYITLYHEVIFLSWDRRILGKVESLMIILSPPSLASFRPPSSGGFTVLLCDYLTETCNKFLALIVFSKLPSIET